MKTINSFLFVSWLALSAGCSKSKPENPYYVSFVMNGTSEYTTTATASIVPNGSVLYTLLTTATFGPATLSLDFQPKLGVSYFQLDQANAVFDFVNTGSLTTDYYTAYQGSVDVTTLTSTTVGGTFSFSATSVQDTPGQAVNGAFMIKMQ